VDDDCDMNSDGGCGTGHVHQECPPASLTNGRHTVPAYRKKQNDRGPQSWVVASRNDRLDGVNEAIQDNQIDCDESEANANSSLRNWNIPRGQGSEVGYPPYLFDDEPVNTSGKVQQEVLFVRSAPDELSLAKG
jgi:hypothetical protein